MATVAVGSVGAQARAAHCLIATDLAAVMLEVTPRRVRQLTREHRVIGCVGKQQRLTFRLMDIEQIAAARHG